MRFDNQFKTWAGPEKSISGGFLKTFYFQRDLPPPPPQKQLDPGPIASQGGSLPVLLRKPIDTFAFFRLDHISRTLPECQTIMIHLMTDVLLVLICI